LLDRLEEWTDGYAIRREQKAFNVETIIGANDRVGGRRLPLSSDDRTRGIDPANCRRCAKAVPAFGLWGSLALGLLELSVGLTFASTALVADAMSSAGTALASGTTQILTKRSSRPADALHPFGHGKVLPLGTLFVNILLLLLGAAIVVVAILRVVSGTIVRPHPTALLGALVAVAASMMLQKYFSCVAARNESQPIREQALARRIDWFASLVVPGGIAGAIWVHPMFDVAAAIVVGVVRGWGSVARLPRVADSLMDRGLGKIARAAIEEQALRHEGVLGIHEILSRRIGDSYWVGVGVQVAPNLPVRDAESVAASLCAALEDTPDCQHVEVVLSPHVS
jgi:cation diffusion facilitator family transporter